MSGGDSPVQLSWRVRNGWGQPEGPQEQLRVKRHKPEAALPQRATDGSAGYDLCSAIDCSVEAGGRLAIPTEISIAVPSGHYGRIAPRSGLAMKRGINVGAGVRPKQQRDACPFQH